MIVNHAQEKIINILKEGMFTATDLAAQMGPGYTELKIQSMVLTLARKGKVDKIKAALILRDTPMIKWLNKELGSSCAQMPIQRVRG